jgi:hypothetical protein
MYLKGINWQSVDWINLDQDISRKDVSVWPKSLFSLRYLTTPAVVEFTQRL